MIPRDAQPRITSLISAAVAGWLVYLAVDFLLHGAVLASWWRATGSFWLPPQMLFERIPLAYASFAMYAVLLTGMLVRLIGPNPAILKGFGFGALAGCVSGV